MNPRYIPNIITCVRFLLLIPVGMTLLAKDYRMGFLVLAIAGISDGIDGFLARYFNWTSRFGAIADPLADKLLMLISYLSLTVTNDIPVWLFVTVVGRDIIIMLGVLLYYYLVEIPQFTASFLSKINTFLQIFFVLLLLFDHGFYSLPAYFLPAMMYLVFCTTILSFLDYTWMWGKRAITLWRVIH